MAPGFFIDSRLHKRRNVVCRVLNLIRGRVVPRHARDFRDMENMTSKTKGAGIRETLAV